MEFWGDDVVALYDVERGRRYRTDDWPRRRDAEAGLLRALVGVLILCPLVLGLSIVVRGARARRARPADM